jgi:protein gp37
MFAEQRRYGLDPEQVVRTKTWGQPRKWQRDAEAAGRRDLVFTCSWSDWFHGAADSWRADAWRVVRDCPNLVFQVLTKRHQRMLDCLPADWGDGYENVWLGVTAESQCFADERVPVLLSVPARVRFISAEPLLGPLDLCFLGGGQVDTPYDLRGNFWEVACENHCDFAGREDDLVPDPRQSDEDVDENGTRWVCPRCHSDSALVERDRDDPGIDWAIVGCEQLPGHKAGRFADGYESAARALVKQCRYFGVSCFHKQMPIGGRVSGDPEQWPGDLRVQEFPK